MRGFRGLREGFSGKSSGVLLLEGITWFLEPATSSYAFSESNLRADLELRVYPIDEKAIRRKSRRDPADLETGKSYRNDRGATSYRFATGALAPGVAAAALPGAAGVGATSGIGLGVFDRRPVLTSSMTTLLFSRIVPCA